MVANQRRKCKTNKLIAPIFTLLINKTTSTSLGTVGTPLFFGAGFSTVAWIGPFENIL